APTALAAAAAAYSAARSIAMARMASRGLPDISNWLPPTVTVVAPPLVRPYTALISRLRLPPTVTVWSAPTSFWAPLVILVSELPATALEELLVTNKLSLLPTFFFLLFAVTIWVSYCA